jgi:NAD-dependent deacetylase
LAGQVATEPAQRLAELIGGAERAVVLTGAGISVPSGIPDFRTPGTGLWENVDPFEVAHIDAFHGDTARFWSFYRPRFEGLASKAPNAAHAAVAELERRGLVQAVITQNIDRLHRAAGSRRIVEVHGSIASSSCLECGTSFALEQVEALFGDDGVASCSGCRGKVKPDVVLFGELLPERAMAEAQELCEAADLLICIGSSLEVYPVAGLPSVALNRGARLAIVTQGTTPYDRDATVKLEGDVVDELDAVLAAL